MELDWSVGAILDTVDTLEERDNTIIVFTSDNGPSIARHQRGGCAGLLRCGKGTTYEGGVRVPGLISYPSIISPGVRRDVFSMLDILPNIINLVDCSTKQIEPLTRCLLFYPDSPQPEKGPYAIRCGAYKAHVYTSGSSARETHHYNLDTDPGERWDLSGSLPALARDLVQELDTLASSVSWATSQMERGNSKSAAPCCAKYPCQPWPACCDCQH